METINHVLPERLTPDERRREVAGVIAGALVRIRRRAAESGSQLGFGAQPSVHALPGSRSPRTR